MYWDFFSKRQKFNLNHILEAMDRRRHWPLRSWRHPSQFIDASLHGGCCSGFSSRKKPSQPPPTFGTKSLSPKYRAGQRAPPQNRKDRHGHDDGVPGAPLLDATKKGLSPGSTGDGWQGRARRREGLQSGRSEVSPGRGRQWEGGGGVRDALVFYAETPFTPGAWRAPSASSLGSWGCSKRPRRGS